MSGNESWCPHSADNSARVSRMLVLLVSVAVAVLLLTTPAHAFTDVPASHPHHDAIEELSGEGIVNGFGDGTFGPEKSVRRSQFAKMILNALEIKVTEADVSTFYDVEVSGPSSLYPDNYVAVAQRLGITKGVTSTRFEPYASIPRNQILTMVVRAAQEFHPGSMHPPGLARWGGGWNGLMPGQQDPVHGDNIRIAEWNQLLAGLMPWTLDPWAPATRAEVAQILVNMKSITTSFSGGSPPLPVGQFPGRRHTGETLFVLVAGLEEDRRAGLERLWEARAWAGEFQTYFILDRSDHYDGLPAGQWVVMEPHEEPLDIGSSLKDRIPGSYESTVTVKCPDLFTTYDEQMRAFDGQ